jgi:hypothetical protein
MKTIHINKLIKLNDTGYEFIIVIHIYLDGNIISFLNINFITIYKTGCTYYEKILYKVVRIIISHYINTFN